MAVTTVVAMENLYMAEDKNSTLLEVVGCSVINTIAAALLSILFGAQGQLSISSTVACHVIRS